MDNPPDQESFRLALTQELEALDAEDDQASADRRPVELDQQSVGRLSRMDALQQQAIALATQRRRNLRRAQIKAALMRIEDGEYGYCLDCGEEISAARLRLDPALPRCQSCTAG